MGYNDKHILMRCPAHEKGQDVLIGLMRGGNDRQINQCPVNRGQFWRSPPDSRDALRGEWCSVRSGLRRPALGRVGAYLCKVIILTGLDDAMVAIRAVREGAQDYLVKGQVDGNLLTRSMYYAIARKTAEKRVKHLNSIFRAFRSITMLTVVEKDRECLLRKACDILEDIRGYDAVWLGLLQNGGTFATVVGSGAGFGYEENVPGLCDHLMRGDIPQCVSDALECEDRFMVVDKSISCEGCFFGDAYPESETVIVPVGHEERLFGLFIVSLATDLATEYEEIELLMDVSDNMGFALHTLEMEDSVLKQDEVR